MLRLVVSYEVVDWYLYSFVLFFTQFLLHHFFSNTEWTGLMTKRSSVLFWMWCSRSLNVRCCCECCWFYSVKTMTNSSFTHRPKTSAVFEHWMTTLTSLLIAGLWLVYSRFYTMAPKNVQNGTKSAKYCLIMVENP